MQKTLFENYLLSRPFDKIKKTRVRGRWPRDLRKQRWFSCARHLEKSVHAYNIHMKFINAWFPSVLILVNWFHDSRIFCMVTHGWCRAPPWNDWLRGRNLSFPFRLFPLKRPQFIFQIFIFWVWYDPHLTYFGWPSKVKLFLSAQKIWTLAITLRG